MTEQATKLGSCIMGAGTDTPCTRPATVELEWDLPESVTGDANGWCALHAAMRPLWDEVDDLSLGLEVLHSWEERAADCDSRHLGRVVAAAKADLSERLGFLVGHTEAIKEAEIGQRS